MAKYEKFSKEELLALVLKQDSELATKKYGLIWDSEREPERVVLDCAENLPVLKAVESKTICEPVDNQSPDHILIEGDNYHALTVLNYTHREKIDVIYIDPPYNTGHDDFKYNDRFVDEEDGFRHSKWLNFMQKRLVLARELLKDTGVIFISIDDNEHAQLKLLCDKIFGEKNGMGPFVQNKQNSKNDSINIQKNHEYIFVYRKIEIKKEGKILPSLVNRTFNTKEVFQEGADYYYYLGDPITTRGDGGILNARKNLGYSVYFNPQTGDFKGVMDYDIELAKISNSEDEVYTTDLSFITKGYICIRPPRVRGKLGAWTWDISRFNSHLNEIHINKTKSSFSLKKKNFVNAKDIYKINDKFYFDLRNENGNSRSILDFSTNEGTEVYNQILDPDTFNNPKNVNMIKFLLSIYNGNGDKQIILDFFAGSGTTGQAVLELNNESKDLARSFILCTNNEVGEKDEDNFKKKFNLTSSELRDWKSDKKIKWQEYQEECGISSSITYPRLKKVICGYNKNSQIEFVPGLGGNLRYFKTDFVKDTKNKVQVRIDVTRQCTEMLCVKEGIFNKVVESRDYRIFTTSASDKHLCVYYNYLEDSFADFLKEIKELSGEKVVYIFSSTLETNRKLFKGIKNLTLEPIPQTILDVYNRLVKINIPPQAGLMYQELETAKTKLFDEGNKDEAARLLRIVLESIVKKVAHKNGLVLVKESAKDEKSGILNDQLYKEEIFTKVQWEENKTLLAIGNHAAHGEYSEYTQEQVEHGYLYLQSLLTMFGL